MSNHTLLLWMLSCGSIFGTFSAVRVSHKRRKRNGEKIPVATTATKENLSISSYANYDKILLTYGQNVYYTKRLHKKKNYTKRSTELAPMALTKN